MAQISLWELFEQKLHEQSATFDELDSDTEWTTLLTEFGFCTLDRGKLLKQIKEKKALSSGKCSLSLLSSLLEPTNARPHRNHIQP
jgi:adenylylsulfate kinase-like enzyme